MNLVIFIELLAVIASATYGLLLASRNDMDVVGAFTVASIAAFGGGTLRDLFLDRQPLFWIGNPHYVIIVFCMSIASVFLIRFLPRIKPFLLAPDALGMGLFTAAGTVIALQHDCPWFIAAILGTITGTFGGALADIVCNNIPTIFRSAPLCATCSFVGAWVLILTTHFKLAEPWAVTASTLTVFMLRLAAVKWNWRWPALRPTTDG